GGGTIGSDALVGLTANSVSAGGFFQSFISTNAGGSIAGNAQNVVAVSGDLSANGGILIATYDTGFLSVNPTTFIAGGTIGGNASVLLTAQDILTTSTASGTPGLDIMALEASIYTNGSSDGLEGGQIGENATISVAAASIQAASLLAEINNSQGGQIGGSASINVFASGAVVVTNDATFRIDGSDGATSAAVNFNGGN